MPANSAAEGQVGDFNLYLHPATTQTTYTGVVEVGFLGDGTRTGRLDVKQVVPPTNASRGPIGASISGMITTRPGQYRVVIDLQAVSSSGEKVTLKHSIPVTVTAANPSRHWPPGAARAARPGGPHGRVDDRD